MHDRFAEGFWSHYGGWRLSNSISATGSPDDLPGRVSAMSYDLTPMLSQAGFGLGLFDRALHFVFINDYRGAHGHA